MTTEWKKIQTAIPACMKIDTLTIWLQTRCQTSILVLVMEWEAVTINNKWTIRPRQKQLRWLSNRHKHSSWIHKSFGCKNSQHIIFMGVTAQIRHFTQWVHLQVFKTTKYKPASWKVPLMTAIQKVQTTLKQRIIFRLSHCMPLNRL